jgi:putative ABC transport system permease protein
MNILWQDLKSAARTLMKSPSFSIVVILTIALGIGANSAIFSVVDTVLLKALPFPEPDQIVTFVNVTPEGVQAAGSATKFNIWRAQNDVFHDVTAYRFGVANLTGDGDPEQIPSGQVSAGFFRLFGAPIVLGRSFAVNEDLPNGGHVAIISDGLWRRRFGRDIGIVGKTLSLGGDTYQIVGVVGSSFNRERFDPIPDVWLPFQLSPDSIDQAHYFTVAGRLRPGVTMKSANSRMQLVATEFRRKYPDFGPKNSFGVRPIRETLVGDVRPSLRTLGVAVFFVLLISCANVANLLLVRATAKRRELTIRSALGSGRGRIVRQLLTECILLSLAGGALGLLIGFAGMRSLLTINPGSIPLVGRDGGLVVLDWRVVAFTILVSALTGLLFGIVPALQISRVDLRSVLQEGGARAGIGARPSRTRAVLVVSELALAVILLIGSVLLIRTFVALHKVNPGFEAENVLTMPMSVAGPRFEKTADIARLIRTGLDRVRTLPGVAAASVTCCVPLEGGYGLPFIVDGRPLEGPSHGGAGWLTISSGYFDTFKIPVKHGRGFTDADSNGAPAVAIISESMARKFWPTSNPLDDRIVIGKGVGPEFEGDPPRQIVGIVGDVRFTLSEDPPPVVYIPWAQTLDGVNALNVRLTELKWVVRTNVASESLRPAIQRELREASGGLPVADTRSMNEVVRRSAARQDFNMILMSVFAGLALLLAALGVYGLISYSVQQRAQEIGIRMALGAEPNRVRSMIIFQTLRLVALALTIGVASSLALARLISSVLFGVKPRDLEAFAMVPVLLGAVALIAAWLPAHRASQINATDALRYE